MGSGAMACGEAAGGDSRGVSRGDALAWLRQFAGMSSALVLNVVGPRESKSPGIQAKTKAFLSEVLREV